METPPKLPPIFQEFERQQKQKTKFGNIIRWIVGLMFILSGISFIPNGNVLTGFCVLLSGLLLLPPVISFIQQILKFSIRSIILYPVIVIVFLIGAINSKDLKVNSNKESDTSNSVNAPVANNLYSDYNVYLSKSENAIAQLNEKQKAARQKALAELQNDSTYIELVNKQVVNEKYLVALQAIGESIITLKTSDNTFSISLLRESELKKIPGALRFVIRTIGLESLGGVSKEILAVYSRYLLNYHVAGYKGTTIYHTDPNYSETISKNYTLAPALVIFQPQNKSFLDSYYEAIQDQLIYWYDDSSDYKYAFLRGRLAFNDYLKNNYPESKYLVNYDLVTTAPNLWADYDANEEAADEKYKNKVIAVKGTVVKIAKNFLDEPYISLKTEDFSEIECLFKDGSKLKSLSKGEYLTIVGTCTGKMSITVDLSDCRIF